MNYPRNQKKVLTAPAVWRCNPCDIWWCSQPAEMPETWQMARMVELYPEPEQSFNQCPIWVVAGPDPSVCPECGSKLY